MITIFFLASHQEYRILGQVFHAGCCGEVLEAPGFCLQISFAITHGKSWNCCSLEAVPDSAHKGGWESHTGIKTLTFSDTVASEDGKKRGAWLILSGNVKLTMD